MPRQRHKSRDTVDGNTISLRCHCRARLAECWLVEHPDGTVEVDWYPTNKRWSGPTRVGSTDAHNGIKNIADEDWFRVVCRCGRDHQGRKIQIAGCVLRASRLGLESASMELLPSTHEAEALGARHVHSRPNRWRQTGRPQ
jgi:hypothetical protein